MRTIDDVLTLTVAVMGTLPPGAFVVRTDVGVAYNVRCLTTDPDSMRVLSRKFTSATVWHVYDNWVDLHGHTGRLFCAVCGERAAAH